jgi:hypothetical protein
MPSPLLDPVQADEATAFAPCPSCGVEVQHARWTPLGWQALGAPVAPVTGRPHVCPTHTTENAPCADH